MKAVFSSAGLEAQDGGKPQSNDEVEEGVSSSDIDGNEDEDAHGDEIFDVIRTKVGGKEKHSLTLDIAE
ncbi:hypothetical protein U1Q18_041806, partial [Sarracenia purpurea var. burkii]